MVLFLRNHLNRACEEICWRGNVLEITKQGFQLKNQRHKRLMGDKDSSPNNNDNI